MKLKDPQARPIHSLRSYQVPNDQEIRQVSKLYEQQFLNEMMKAMRQSVPEAGFIPKSMGEKIYMDQLDHEYVQQWSAQGELGLSELIYQEIKEKILGPDSPEFIKPLKPQPMPLKDSGVKSIEPVKTQTDGLTYKLQMEQSAQQVKTLFSGTVVAVQSTGENEAIVTLDHEEPPMKSVWSFSGVPHGLRPGRYLEAGDEMGRITSGTGQILLNLRARS